MVNSKTYSLCGNKWVGVWRTGAYMRVVTLLSLATILVDWCCLILSWLWCWFFHMLSTFMHVQNLSIYHEDVHGVEVLLSMWFIGKLFTKLVWNNSDGALNYPSLVTLLKVFWSFVHVKCVTSNIISSRQVSFGLFKTSSPICGSFGLTFDQQCCFNLLCGMSLQSSFLVIDCREDVIDVLGHPHPHVL